LIFCSASRAIRLSALFLPPELISLRLFHRDELQLDPFDFLLKLLELIPRL
jgi:hypothetical protein